MYIESNKMPGTLSGTHTEMYIRGGLGSGRVEARPKTKPKLKTFELNSRSNVYVDEGLCHCVGQQQQANRKRKAHRQGFRRG